MTELESKENIHITQYIRKENGPLSKKRVFSKSQFI